MTKYLPISTYLNIQSLLHSFRHTHTHIHKTTHTHAHAHTHTHTHTLQTWMMWWICVLPSCEPHKLTTHKQPHTICERASHNAIMCWCAKWCGGYIFIFTPGEHVTDMEPERGGWQRERPMRVHAQHSITSARPHGVRTHSVTSSIQPSQTAHSPHQNANGPIHHAQRRRWWGGWRLPLSRLFSCSNWEAGCTGLWPGTTSCIMCAQVRRNGDIVATGAKNHCYATAT